MGDSDVAGVGARASNHIARELGTRASHADGLEPGVQHGQLRLGETSEDDVLPVAEAHVGTELALDRRQGAELGRGHITQGGVGDCGDGAVGRAAHDAGDGAGVLVSAGTVRLNTREESPIRFSR